MPDTHTHIQPVSALNVSIEVTRHDFQRTGTSAVTAAATISGVGGAPMRVAADAFAQVLGMRRGVSPDEHAARDRRQAQRWWGPQHQQVAQLSDLLHAIGPQRFTAAAVKVAKRLGDDDPKPSDAPPNLDGALTNRVYQRLLDAAWHGQEQPATLAGMVLVYASYALAGEPPANATRLHGPLAATLASLGIDPPGFMTAGPPGADQSVSGRGRGPDVSGMPINGCCGANTELTYVYLISG